MANDTRLWQCPGCGKSFRIPAHRDDPAICLTCRDAEDANQIEVVSRPGTPPPPRAAKTRKSNQQTTMIVLGVLLLFLVGAVANYQAGEDEIEAQQERSRELNEEMRESQDRRFRETMREIQEEPQREWVKVGSWKGGGPKSTGRFPSRHGELRITWAASPSGDFGGYFGATVEGEGIIDTHLIANQTVDSDAGDQTHIHGEAGSYYLDINSANAFWVVEVEDLR